MNTLFKLRGSSKIPEGSVINCIPRGCPKTEKKTHFHSLDLINLQEDKLIGGGPEPMLNYVQTHPNFSKIKHPKEPDLIRGLSKDYIEGLTPTFSNHMETFKNAHGQYGAIQFRSFFDYHFHKLPQLEEFLKKFSQAHEKFPEIKTIFITTDSLGISFFIKYHLRAIHPSLNFTVSNWPQCPCCGDFSVRHTNFKPSTNKNNAVITLKDWSLLTGASYLYSNGASFGDAAAQTFDIPHVNFNRL